MRASDLMEMSADELVEQATNVSKNTLLAGMIEREFRRREHLLLEKNTELQAEALRSQIEATEAQKKSAFWVRRTGIWTAVIAVFTFAAALIAALVASGYAGKDAPLLSTVECQSGSQHIYDSDGNFKACISIKELEELE